MSMKCRCGSDDKLVVQDGKVVRTADNKPHVCIGQEKPTNFSNDEFLKKKQKEILVAKSMSPVTAYTIKQNLILEEMEHVLIEEDPKLEKNVQKLGMKLKIIYQSMPDDMKK